VVQPDEGIWIHPAYRWRQGRVRSYFGGRASWPQLFKRGTNRRIRDREQSRKRVCSQSQGRLIALAVQQTEFPELDCQSCGACCSFSSEWPCFSLESDAHLDQIPRSYVDDDLARMRCNGNRCTALVGDVGVSTRCVIYAIRPDVCRACLPGDDCCQAARARFNL
jgi:uncharacterized protein